jgi:hypothetical protein
VSEHARLSAEDIEKARTIFARWPDQRHPIAKAGITLTVALDACRAELAAARARQERLREALRWFVDKDFVDSPGWIAFTGSREEHVERAKALLAEPSASGEER